MAKKNMSNWLHKFGYWTSLFNYFITFPLSFMFFFSLYNKNLPLLN